MKKIIKSVRKILFENEKRMLDKIGNFISDNVNIYSPKKLKLVRKHNISKYCNDRGNELLFLYFLENENENDFEFPIIDIKEFSKLLSGEFDSFHLYSYFNLNTQICFPICYLD